MRGVHVWVFIRSSSWDRGARGGGPARARPRVDEILNVSRDSRECRDVDDRKMKVRGNPRKATRQESLRKRSRGDISVIPLANAPRLKPSTRPLFWRRM